VTSIFLRIGAGTRRRGKARLPAKHVPPEGGIDLSFLQPSTRSGTLGRLGRYEIESVIGRAGCGIVLKAFDETPAGASRTARRAARATMPTPVWRKARLSGHDRFLQDAGNAGVHFRQMRERSLPATCIAAGGS
jgi:hypothetical protein